MNGDDYFLQMRPISRFSLSSDFKRIIIWRERGSRNHPSNIIGRRHGGRDVLVWGGIMLGSRTDLHIFDAGSVNGTRYLRILKVWIGRHDLSGSQSHRACMGFSRQTLEARTLPPVTFQASIGAARRNGSNALTILITLHSQQMADAVKP
ncbi:hypothetical protein TNCV_2789141 [Trichonephila clavipes]|uniref:Uncharacterized protein n=1 Tax=Trichonephila clavipes TaxID=2585209 RepID=A0A8X6VWI3_TRICX|nr:hypothetical protein TNCV_2789141 [Trichonephila clavipes]